ncbi:MAG: TusE/DsrC/DsvC family sulfur relay protein [Chromatiales bacterium]|nr:TusE/DsrC/DsvC family sulfur relay protein [Chromatiales bacterium]
MAIEFDGKTIETTETGFLTNIDDWNEGIAEIIAKEEGIELTQEHWDVIHYLRDEFIENRGHQPNNREMLKTMGDRWGKKVSSKDMYNLFPGNPSKQAGRIGGLPESMRKGGY